MTPRKSFFETLFDLSFDSSIAVKVISLLYVISLVLAALACLSVVVATEGFLSLLVRLIVAPIAWLVYATFVRVGLEALVASIKTAENTTQMLDLMRQQTPRNS